MTFFHSREFFRSIQLLQVGRQCGEKSKKFTNALWWSKQEEEME